MFSRPFTIVARGLVLLCALVVLVAGCSASDVAVEQPDRDALIRDHGESLFGGMETDQLLIAVVDYYALVSIDSIAELEHEAGLARVELTVEKVVASRDLTWNLGRKVEVKIPAAGDSVALTAPWELALKAGDRVVLGVESLPVHAVGTSGVATVRFDQAGAPTHATHPSLVDSYADLKAVARGESFEYLGTLLEDGSRWLDSLNRSPGEAQQATESLAAPSGLLGSLRETAQTAASEADTFGISSLPFGEPQLPFGAVDEGQLADARRASGHDLFVTDFSVVGLPSRPSPVTWVALRFKGVGLLGPLLVDSENPSLVVFVGAVPLGGEYELVGWSGDVIGTAEGSVLASGKINRDPSVDGQTFVLDLANDRLDVVDRADANRILEAAATKGAG